MKCPVCNSDKIKAGTDFYLCNNPHCLHLWGKSLKVKHSLKDKHTAVRGSKKNVKSKGNRRKLRSTKT